MRKKNVVLEQLAVADYAAEGKALGRIDGKVVFVEGAVPGPGRDMVAYLEMTGAGDFRDFSPLLSAKENRASRRPGHIIRGVG